MVPQVFVNVETHEMVDVADKAAEDEWRSDASSTNPKARQQYGSAV